VQECKRIVFVLVWAFALAAVTAAGCSGDRRSGLAKSTDKARRLYDRACAFFNEDVYKIKNAPPKDANDVVPLPAGTINPQATDALTEAQELLSKALASAGNAPPADQLQAREVQARLYALDAYRWSLLADQKRAAAWAVLGQMEFAAITMAEFGKRVAACDQLLAATDAALPKLKIKAQDDADAAKAKISADEESIKKLGDEKDALTATNETLRGDARKLRIDSQLQLANVKKSIDLFDQAKAKEDQATANDVKITEIEDSIAFLKSGIATTEVNVTAAQKLATTAVKIGEDRKTRQGEITTKREGFVTLLTDAQKTVEAQAGKAAEAGKAAADDEAKALAAYAKAQTEYDAYRQVTDKNANSPEMALRPDPAVVALCGDMRMARANLCVRSMLLQKRIEEVVKDVEKLWAALPAQNARPDVVGKVKGYLADPGKTRQDALGDYAQAGKDYEKAREIVARKLDGRNLTWTYDVQIAAAYAGRYHVSGDAEDKQNALKSLDALGDAEKSPLVARLASPLRVQLAGPGGEGGATSAPATAPAAPAVPEAPAAKPPAAKPAASAPAAKPAARKPAASAPAASAPAEK
jgi:hypothetical protein